LRKANYFHVFSISAYAIENKRKASLVCPAVMERDDNRFKDKQVEGTKGINPF